MSEAVAAATAVLPLPRLDMLPEELVSNISHRLDYDDLIALRLVNRAIEAKSFHEFATEYFTAKAFMISSDSLKVLAAISEDKRLRGYLHSIYFINAYFSHKSLTCPNGCVCAWKPTTRQTEAYRYYITDQTQLKDSGDDVRIVAAAVQNLPALQSLYLSDDVYVGEDPENARLHGLRKVIRRTGKPPSTSSAGRKIGEHAEWMSHVWKVMLKAVARSGRTTLTNFGTLIDKSDGLSIAKSLKISPKMFPGLMDAMQNVREMRLTICGKQLYKSEILGKTSLEASADVVSKFAGLFGQGELEDVQLAYDGVLAIRKLHTAFMTGIDSSKLKSLLVDGLWINASTLALGLSDLVAATSVQISWTNLTKGTWVSVLKVIAKLPQLDHLHLMWLQEDGRKCYFLEQKEPEHEDDWMDHGDEEDEEEEEDDEEDYNDLPLFDPTTGSPILTYSHYRRAKAWAAEKTTGDPEFQAPGHEGHLERGYYICLKSEDDIKKFLPIFVKEYNIGDDLADESLFPPFIGGGVIGAGAGAVAGGLPPPLPPGIPVAVANQLMTLLGPTPAVPHALPHQPPPNRGGAQSGPQGTPGYGPALPPGMVSPANGNSGSSSTGMAGQMPLPSLPQNHNHNQNNHSLNTTAGAAQPTSAGAHHPNYPSSLLPPDPPPHSQEWEGLLGPDDFDNEYDEDFVDETQMSGT
ncbi:hypothetical protein LTR62_003285 [Meristemomyces frigidus]|uniref:F-box domain-containing protein n=1 Tax=Meristemomyces frigidus TaxID=1508187 RepID=A0AAN7YH23_9PEZI|nr:hypothetical protein LTR62_003285 [Meristemomyces frigidus]